jgi:sugar phosphate isomerase/epimerase
MAVPSPTEESNMKRRDFLTRISGGVAATGLAGSISKVRAAAPGQASSASAAGKLSRIAVSTWSLHNYFPSTREPDFTLPGKRLELLDFPEMIADRYQVHHLEFCAPHFAATEPSYLQELKSRLAKARSQVTNMPVDIQEIWTGGGLSDPDKQVRGQAVNAAQQWIDVAATIGSQAVRCDPGKMQAENLAPTIESYKALAAYGMSKGVHVVVENHGGVGSEHPEELVKLFKGVNSRFFGALPDFANFPDEPTRERGLNLLLPYARIVCHAKGLEFDASGKETRFNFPKCMEIAKTLGFKGIYSIEYEGPGDPYEGVQKVLDELLKYM